MMTRKIIDDGFSPYLIDESKLDGKWEIPFIKNEVGEPPKNIVPFNKRKQIKDKESTFIHFYIDDEKFAKVVSETDHFLEEFKGYAGIISPDCSLYIDMPLCLQLVNVYRSRAIGSYFQNNGVRVIPNVRWGDERSFEFCFDGLEPYGVYSVGTYGCIKSKENKLMFKTGFNEMIDRLKPKKVMVYGAMPETVFADFKAKTEFIAYQDWTKMKKGKSIRHLLK